MKPFRKSRICSGRGIFLKERLSGCGERVGTNLYKQLLADLSTEWNGLSADAKQAYSVRAHQQQVARRSFADHTLADCVEPDPDLILAVIQI